MTVLVLHYAMSGGTLIAVAADEIVMDSHAVLGPFDPQLGEYPAASLIKAVKAKDVNKVDDRTLILADIGEKSLGQIRAEVLELLTDKMPADKAASVADKLSQGTWTHDHPIGLKEARELGLPVRGDMPDEFYRLMCLSEAKSKSRASHPGDSHHVPMRRQSACWKVQTLPSASVQCCQRTIRHLETGVTRRWHQFEKRLAEF